MHTNKIMQIPLNNGKCNVILCIFHSPKAYTSKGQGVDCARLNITRESPQRMLLNRPV